MKLEKIQDDIDLLRNRIRNVKTRIEHTDDVRALKKLNKYMDELVIAQTNLSIKKDGIINDKDVI